MAKAEPLVTITIPPRYVRRNADSADTMRRIIDSAYRVALGRCDWKTDIIITGTVEQFGVFCYLLAENNLQVGLCDISVEMFVPKEPKDGPVVFNAVGARPKRLHIPTKEIPSPSPFEVS